MDKVSDGKRFNILTWQNVSSWYVAMQKEDIEIDNS